MGIVDGEIITLKSIVAGTIEKLNIREGEKVTKGSIILQIRREKIENQLKGFDINLKEIEINSEKMKKKLKFIFSTIKHIKKQVERYKRLIKKNSISGEKLENMELKLIEAETSKYEIEKTLESLAIQKEKINNKKEYLNLLLDDHIVKSPVDGVIVEKFVSKGENIFPSSPLVEILNTSSLYVEIFIEEREISFLKINQQVKIIIDGMEERKLSGTISFFGKKAEFSPKYIISEKERKSLLYQVKISLYKNIDVFKVGMPVTVQIFK